MKIWTDRIRQVKVVLLVTAVVIAVVSLVVSHKLVRDLQHEEVAKMEVWAEAMRTLSNSDETTDLNLVLKVINSNNNIPLVVLDGAGNVTTHRNVVIEARDAADSLAVLEQQTAEFVENGTHLTIPIASVDDSGNAIEDSLHIYYSDSLMLKRLSLFPFVQLGVVGLFVVVAIFALLSSKKAEQNKVWVGLSKETAHQLGTPISSLMAWSDVLSETYPDDEMITEMRKDVTRLQLIAERFSKIGSVPELKDDDLCDIIDHVIVYIRRRTSSQVAIERHFPSEEGGVVLPLCAPLIEWVIEVLCKNAIDAMAGEGRIDVTVKREDWTWVVEVADTGKGIARKDFKNVFRPGYTTKQRGWGLGLSLAKRIVEEYHRGHIFVKSSEQGKGTTFRIELRA